MLRSFLIYLSQAAWAKNLVTNWSFARRAASRFIAGETLSDGLQAIRSLNEKGILATVDHLGEHTTTSDESRQAAQAIIDIFDSIDQSGVRANVSVKLTQIGLALDPELCAENLDRILETSCRHKNFVRIDMEDAPWTEATLALYLRMLEKYGTSCLGIVIQSYLYRSETDVQRIMDDQGRVRLCKGAYKEPPEVAFPAKRDVDANYDLLADMLLEGALAAGAPEVSPDGKIPPIPAIASHDEVRIAHAREYAARIGLPKKAIEFQMLHGIRRDLQEQLAADGYPVRVYVPYGTQWYPYFTRRLAERPANIWFFISNFFRR